MKSVYEMDLEEMKHLTLKDSKKLDSAERAYLTRELIKHKVIKNDDLDLILAMEFMD